jgi:hypothetical protein
MQVYVKSHYSLDRPHAGCILVPKGSQVHADFFVGDQETLNSTSQPSSQTSSLFSSLDPDIARVQYG